MDDRSGRNAKEYVAGLMARARAAQRVAESYGQERVDELVTAIAWAAVKDENARPLAELAVAETRMGDFEGKYRKLTKKTRGVLREMKGAKSVGVIEVDEAKGLVKIGKPVGVVGAIVPCTNPCITPVLKAMCAIKGRNAIVFSPHPRSRKTTNRVIEILRSVLEKRGAPADLLVCVEDPDVETSLEVMRQSDLVVATGGSEMVKAAYGSGKPAYGVGAGNAVSVVDETADRKDAAHKIMLSKTNDLATGCSTENALVVQEGVYADMLEALRAEGGYVANAAEKAMLRAAMWRDGVLNKDIVARSARTIAGIAGFDIPADRTFLVVEEDGIGRDHPFSGEKLSVVLAAYRYGEFDEAVRIVNAIHAYSGAGHSCGIHSFDEAHILKLALETRTGRVLIRQPQNYGNAGDWSNGMPWTTTLGCGTWGGNITSENITWKHYINTTWVSYPIDPVVPTDEELFGNIMRED